MKNRKAPVMLFGIVVIAVGAMTVFNAMQRPQTPEARQEAQQDEAKEHKVTDQDRAAVANNLFKKLGPGKSTNSTASAAGSPRKNTPVAAEDMDLTQGLAKEPTIFLSTTTSFAPEPNDSSPSMEWYRKESRSAMKAEESASGKG